MPSLPTVRIKHPCGYAIINESDFDSSRHVLYSEGPKHVVDIDADAKQAIDEAAAAAKVAADKAKEKVPTASAGEPMIPDFSKSKK